MIRRGIHGKSVRLVLFALALVLAGYLLPGTQRGTHAPAAPARWLGPIATLARDIQWIRYQRALLAGQHETALERAESALELDPGSTAGWLLIASHFAFFRASPEREQDVERRRAWFLAGVNATERGARVAGHPGELHFLRGLMYFSKIEIDPQLLPGGEPELRAAAVSAFEDAAEAGHPEAGAMLAGLRPD